MESTLDQALLERLEKEAAEIAKEFQGRVRLEEVRRTLLESAERFADVRVKDFVPLFAGIATRQALRRWE